MRVVSAILFSPRGGSAHAARALARGLRSHGHEVTLLSGSRSDLEGDGDAADFYDQVRDVSFDQALATDAPLQYEGPPGTAPMHPSFEDRPGAPDQVFAKLDDAAYERQVSAWARELERAGAADADILHLHHLTPINEAARRVAPNVPIVSQLHGTELLMLEHIVTGAEPRWPFAEQWAKRLLDWARSAEKLLVVPGGARRASELLDLPTERFLPLPNGVDVELFARRDIDRKTFWQQMLIDRPRGWLPGQRPGSTRYEAGDVERLAAGTIFIYVGRFTAVKRLDLLIGAFQSAKEQFDHSAGLVLVGGHPGEWEGEHPAEIVERTGADNVFLAGWHSHLALPDFLSAADAVVLTSDREQFGQVLVEGMACGLPVIATRSVGPDSILDDGRTGWLVDIGDETGLARVMAQAVNDPAERDRRGELGRAVAREGYSWSGIATQLAEFFEEILSAESQARPVGV
jgi:glycosyltransferase involved in cell wall biosynthesis